MFDKIVEIKNDIIKRTKNIGLIRGIEIGSGLVVLFGITLVSLFNDDVEVYDSELIEIDDVAVKDSNED